MEINPIFNINIFKILEQFFYTGLNRLQISQIIERTHYDFKTVKKYLKQLLNLKLITEQKDLTRPTYEANYRNRYFLTIKSEKLVNEIFQSRLPEYLNQNLGETACILFGSCARGDYYQDSDVDIYIQSKKKKLNIKPYEKKIKRSINIFFEPKWQTLNKGMQTGLLNDGIAINGRLKL